MRIVHLPRAFRAETGAEVGRHSEQGGSLQVLLGHSIQFAAIFPVVWKSHLKVSEMDVWGEER